MAKLKSFLIIALITCTAIFALQNAEVVEIEFLFWSFSLPRVFMILALLVAGFAIGLLVASLASLKHKQE